MSSEAGVLGLCSPKANLSTIICASAFASPTEAAPEIVEFCVLALSAAFNREQRWGVCFDAHRAFTAR